MLVSYEVNLHKGEIMQRKSYQIILSALLVLSTSSALFAFDIGGIHVNQPSTPSVSTGGVSGVGQKPEAVADEVVAYIRQKWPVSGDVFKANLAQVVPYMKAKYGNPANQNNIYAEWMIHPKGSLSDCAKMRFSFDGHAMNITRSLGPCDLVRSK